MRQHGFLAHSGEFTRIADHSASIVIMENRIDFSGQSAVQSNFDLLRNVQSNHLNQRI
jgi:hypothetical protein